MAGPHIRRWVAEVGAGVCFGSLVGLGGAWLVAAPVAGDADHAAVAARADFGAETPSDEARSIADWVAVSHDNAGMAFAIVDKRQARIYVFDAQAHLIGASAVLLGSARGDDSVPGIGVRPIPLVRPQERTTPAGRFVAERGIDAHGQDVVWVDYDDAVSSHRVLTTDRREHRIERLASPSVADNRITYGCINLPASFFERVVAPMFAQRRGVVYVLPEVKSLRQVFGVDIAALGAGEVRAKGRTS
jgi:hypothetical protein